MPTIDAMRLLAMSVIALVAVTTVVWLLRRPSGLRPLVFGCVLSILCMAVPAAVMAFGPLPETEQVIGHASARIPAAEPYHAVPPPELGRHGEMIEVGGKGSLAG